MTSPLDPVIAPQSAPTPPTPATAVAPSCLRCGPLTGCAVALLAGLLTWGILQVGFPVFNIPKELRDLPSPQPPELAAKAAQASVVAARWNATLLLAILGLSVAGSLAVAESLLRGTAGSAWWRGLLSGVLAGLCGAVAGLSASLLLKSPQAMGGMSPLARTISVQCMGLGLLGLGIGLGVGSTGPWRLLLNAALGGALAGLLVGFLYPTGMGYLLPNVQTEHVVPIDRTSQLIWLVAVSLLIALVITGLGKGTSNKKRDGVTPVPQ
ncbi:MAG: hypothetical protein MUE50_02635 [Pirellulaceae bacterium]|nr:hypothetical protein [Pirellulaceae bacterium]